MTNVVKIGASRGRSILWQGIFAFKWAPSLKILGIYYDINRVGVITELNVLRKMEETKKLLKLGN